MRITAGGLLCLLPLGAGAFNVASPSLAYSRPNRVSSILAATTDSDCGCAAPIYSGEPSNMAKSMDIRKALTEPTIYNLNGDPVQLKNVIPTKGTSIVVVLRSLG